MAIIDIFAEQNNNMVDSLKGQKILIFGGNSVGKTYQTTRLEKPMLLMTESGGNARTRNKFPIDTWGKFVSVVEQLTGKTYEKAAEKYQTVIIDTGEMLVNLNEDDVARIFGVQDIGQVQSSSDTAPNGYLYARNRFRTQINKLTSYGYTVVFILHEMVDMDEDSPTYKKIIPFNSNKEKGSTRFLRDLCDFVFYVYSNGIDPETGNTIYSSAICRETNKVFARSRYPMMQPTIKSFTAENLEKAILDAIQKTAEDEGAGLVEFKEASIGYSKDDYIHLLQPYVTKLFEIDSATAIALVEEQLGAGKKVTDATDDQITELASLYSTMVDYFTQRNISI